MSRPLFYCDVIQLSRAFKLVVTQICWVACFLAVTWNLGCNQVFSLLSAILVATSKVCHNIPFFISSRNLISKSQHFPSIFLFLVATSLLCFVLEYMSRPRFYVATLVPVASYVDLCCNHVFLTLQIILYQDFSSMSRPSCIVFYCILCHDLRSMSRPPLCCQPLILGHNSLSHVAT